VALAFSLDIAAASGQAGPLSHGRFWGPSPCGLAARTPAGSRGRGLREDPTDARAGRDEP